MTLSYKSERSGFTMTELLVVLGVLTVLVTATVLLLNPTEFTAQSRDSRRISDLKNLDASISLVRNSLYETLTDSTQPNIVYTSLPDSNSDGLCNEYTLPLLGGSWQYRCRASADNLRKVDGNGWIPINFTSVSTNPLTVLPVDPINNENSYYTYSWDSSTKATVWAKLESQKYLASHANNAQGDGGNDDAAFETWPIAWTTTGAPPPSGIEISGCATLDQPGETYLLTADITNSSTPQCINIAADNVTFDCQGHTVDGNDSATYGVYVYRSSIATSNATIQNCTITDWATANIYLRRADGNTISNVTSNSSTSYGVYMDSSSSNDFTTVTTNSNGSRGIVGYGSSNSSTFNGVTASSNAFDGIVLRGINNNLTNITANSNTSGSGGVSIEFTSGPNTLSNINASSNRQGVAFIQSSGTTLNGATLTSNSLYDLYASPSIDSNCNNTVSNVTGTGSKPILYVNSASTISDSNNVYSEILMCNADNSTVSNVTLDHTGFTQNNALFLARTDNSTFNNITLKNLQSGLVVTAGSTGNTFTGVTSTQNDDHGVEAGALSNTFNNVTANSNDFYGIALAGSSNVFDNLTANFNDVGISMSGSSNTIRNSHIESNTPYGISVSSAGSAGANTIYNNVFKNGTNFNFSGTNYTNNWNTTLASGTNIIGGPNIGGNYWTNSSGTGFSDTCADADSNGICDSAYSLAASNVDNYPLKPVAGSAHWDKVDEVTADDLSTYVYTSSITMQKDAYALQDTSQTGTINEVAVYSRTQGCAKFWLRVEGSEYNGSFSICNGGTWGDNISPTISTFDIPGGWTWAKINSMQVVAGLQQDGAYNGRLTQIWARVTYNDSFNLDLRPNGAGDYTNISSQFPP